MEQKEHQTIDLGAYLQDNVLVSLTLGKWGNNGDVDTASVQADADKDMLRVRKRLLRSEEYERIVKFDDATRTYLYSQTVRQAALRRGIYPIRRDRRPALDLELSTRAQEREELVDAFAAAYPALLTRAPEYLRALHRAGDYPSPQKIRESFTMDWLYLQLTAPAEADPGQTAVQQEKVAALYAGSAIEARKLLRQEAAGVVDAALALFSARADGKKKGITEPSVFMWQTFCATFGARDITNDTDLQALVATLSGLVSGVSADGIRASSALREKLQAGLTEVQSGLKALLSGPPIRAIFLD